jgi:hypothetical protein
VPPSIIQGDSLRDSDGVVTHLQAVAFAENGDTIRDADFRYTTLGLTSTTDTTQAARLGPLLVNPISGFVSAPGKTMLAPRARLAARLGDRLQVMDTILLVSTPAQLKRAPQYGDSLSHTSFQCDDSGLVIVADTIRPSVNGVKGDTIRFGNATPVATLLLADTNGAPVNQVPVPGYYVRYDIIQPETIPKIRLASGVTRPALSMIRESTRDRSTNTDTTDQQGNSTAYLRVIGAGLPTTGYFASDTFDVLIRASARLTRTTIVPDPIVFRVHLVRRNQTLFGEPLSGPSCHGG